ncbi:phosphatase PAP2 family protein [Lysobacter pythonis]|uniref:undecaprenyl-diphosphate phosphatase n=1 Tax=Solilutibacter pythonis TaxID=2483112 RepID=A0A3M2HFM6_9GAMM|nr:phosphatase PAP2 family protein [Lysobacter pythonis]RMH87758.1 phosphatase PAP2 family protein [Lysobacter pythonis]
MTPLTTDTPAYRLRSAWLGLLILAIIATLPFWISDLDLAAARVFHDPTSARTPWPLAQHPLFVFLYRLGSGLSWLALGFAASTFLIPRLRPHTGLRQMALILLCSVALGPGLLVNGIGKDFTGRPRPRHVEALGGNSDYRPPLQLGTPGVGKSFPCGHCSVGFTVGSAGFALAQARPLLGGGIVLFSFLLGSAIGIARMAAGAHFLSDVLWAAVLSWAAGLLVTGHMMRNTASTTVSAWPPWLRIAAPTVLVIGVATGLLFARPFHTDVHAAPETEAGYYRLTLDAADLRIQVDPALPTPLILSGELKGFGFPNVDTRQTAQIHTNEWHYQLELSGWPREIEAPLLLRVRPEILPRLDIQVGRKEKQSWPMPPIAYWQKTNSSPHGTE